MELNNREIAACVWLGVLIILILSSRSTRKNIPDIIYAFLDKRILIIVALMSIYIILEVYLLYLIHFWNRELLKDTIIWFIGVGFIQLMNTTKAIKNEGHFKKLIKDSVKFIVAFEFFMNAYVFNLTVELILAPILLFLIMLQLVSKLDRKNKIVTDFVETILSILGLIVFFYVGYKAIEDIRNFASLKNLKNFLFPITLLLAYLPFIYLMSLSMIYENFFVRIDMAFRHNKDLGKYAKLRVIKSGLFNITRARALSEKIRIFDIKTKEEFEKELRDKL